PAKPYKFDPATPGPDIRTRPWFLAAKKAQHPTWTDTYLFLGLEGMQNIVGVTYAVPFQRSANELDSVVSADFDLKALSQFLSNMRVGRSGFSFLVEYREDGTRRVIAHPRPEILMNVTSAGVEVVPIEKLDDPRVRAFMEQAPADLNAAGIK